MEKEFHVVVASQDILTASYDTFIYFIYIYFFQKKMIINNCGILYIVYETLFPVRLINV